MEKYRIKEVKYKSGRKEFKPQVRKLFIWFDLYSDGESSLLPINYYDSFSECQEIIELRKEGNVKITSKTVRYVR